ncbi:MAG: hypothetical protein EOM62_17085 [Bacteroidia bacterium]|nr:hypothetical protein [Bacteroidia bacterium]
MAMRNNRFWCNRKQRACTIGQYNCPDCPRKDTRKSSAKRGYNHSWRQIREQALREYGIAQADWSRYDVDHDPPYDPKIEPDHRKYRLVPRLHADHSSKTATLDTKRDSKGRFLKKVE